MSNSKKIPVLIALCLVVFSCARSAKEPVVYVAADASALERLAADEIRRYLYVTTGELPTLVRFASAADFKKSGIIVDRKGLLTSGPAAAGGGFETISAGKIPVLQAEDYWLRTVKKNGTKFLLVAGGEGTGILYGAYAFAEKLGVRFYLEGDVVPDDKIVFRLPDLDETGRPLFPARGIQPFHDFAEGPDWWNEDTYKAVLAQLPKLKMNFFGLHTYPEKNPNAEPAVWIGTAEDAGPDGRVAFSYPSSWQNTLRSNPWSHNWGYQPTPTGKFHLGASLLFDRDDFGPEVMNGLMPEPQTAEQSNELFNRAGAVLKGAFTLARALGVKTCVGTETPLTVPAVLQERLKKAGKDPKDPQTIKALYEGIFKRIAAAYPIDTYWFWTNENWTWSDAKPEEIKAVATDLDMAVQAARAVSATFSLATCGWVLGPPSRRTLFDEILPKSVAASCINREVGKAPVDPSFARISGRSKWVIPWMEDDPSLTSPQLWAGRMRRDAVDALRYGCDGLFGIHWRTRILSPNVLALARAAWDQSWNNLPMAFAEQIGPINGVYVRTAETAVPGAGETAVYRDVRDRVNGYRILVPDGIYAVTLKFCETEFDKKNARVFDILLQGRKAAESVDLADRAGRFKPYDLSFPGIEVKGGRLAIDFVDRIHYPSIAGIVIQGPGFAKKINCGGGAVLDYDADWPETPRFLAVADFYSDWARNQFGRGPDTEIGALFARIDGKLPIPVTWTTGPGGIRPDVRPWTEVVPGFGFVDELAAIRPRVQGVGNLERFDYWLKNFEAMRETARFQCHWADYNKALEKVKALPDAAARVAAAKATLLPVRIEMVKALKGVLGSLVATVSNTGEMGTIANWEQHLIPDAFLKPGEELKALLGGELPAYADLPEAYDGPARVVVPTVRTIAAAGETLTLKAMVLSAEPPASVTLYWRPLGSGKYAAVEMIHSARNTYRASLENLSDGIEYYILAKAGDREAVFPVTAPALNQTVVVMK
jgi:hypothetical protein